MRESERLKGSFSKASTSNPKSYCLRSSPSFCCHSPEVVGRNERKFRIEIREVFLIYFLFIFLKLEAYKVKKNI